jgi:septal ring factor EnvC (AmiA/AmiB activator)
MTETDESEGEGSEEENTSAQGEMSAQPAKETQTPPESLGEATPAQPQAGRRTQLKIVREGVESLSKEVGRLRKSSEANAEKMEAHLKSLRKELGAHTRSKDLGEHIKSHRVDTARLQQQMASLRKEMASFRSQMAEEAAKSRKQQEAAFAKFSAKVKAAKPKKLKIKLSKRKS